MEDNRISPQEPYELFGVECEDGWKPLYQQVLDYIEEYNKDKEEDEKMRVTQIKEKFGELRVYLNFYTDEVQKIIDDIEYKSAYICEMCGKEIDEPIVKNRWIYPLCEECFNGGKK